MQSTVTEYGKQYGVITGMSLYENINKRKKAGTSRPKSESTISSKSYSNMQAGFPNSKKNKAKKKSKMAKSMGYS